MSNNLSRTYGIDVSVWQGRVTWPQVKNQSHVRFALAKATQGDYLVDPQFQNNWTGIRNAGLIRGAYHFFSPRIHPINQANYFVRQIENTLRPEDFPPIVDIEYYPKYIEQEWQRFSIPDRIDRIRRCLDRVERDTGRVPIIYTSASSWRAITDNDSSFTRYPLWVANYGQALTNPLMPQGNWGGQGWKLWQFSDTGRVRGVSGNVDENWFNGTLQEMEDFIGDGGPKLVDILGKLTNREVVTAFQQAAAGLNSNPTTLLERASLRYIADESIGNQPYDGPLLAEMGLEDTEREAIRQAATGILAARPDGIPAGFTNQDMIDAFYAAAALLGLDGWELVTRANLQELALERSAPYSGPIVSQMALNDNEKAALKDAIGFDTPSVTTDGPYPGLTNQKMINVFYRAAPPAADEYWRWIERAELTWLAIPNTNRPLLYPGPRVENMPGLVPTEKAALLAVLSTLV